MYISLINNSINNSRHQMSTAISQPLVCGTKKCACRFIPAINLHIAPQGFCACALPPNCENINFHSLHCVRLIAALWAAALCARSFKNTYIHTCMHV